MFGRLDDIPNHNKKLILINQMLFITCTTVFTAPNQRGTTTYFSIQSFIHVWVCPENFPIIGHLLMGEICLLQFIFNYLVERKKRKIPNGCCIFTPFLDCIFLFQLCHCHKESRNKVSCLQANRYETLSISHQINHVAFLINLFAFISTHLKVN